jgi:hypothetical protein
VRHAHTVGSYIAHVTADDRNPDTTNGSPAGVHNLIPHYEIRVKGRLAPRWSGWFDGLTIDTETEDGTTAISGPIVDQSALHGLIRKLRDVGLTLVSLTELPSVISNGPPDSPRRTTDMNTTRTHASDRIPLNEWSTHS